MNIKSTPLEQKHIALGAKMAEFAGYNMPISYHGIIDEHHNIRKNVGVFDVSHMGEFIVRGREALDFLQLVTSNDVSKLEIGSIQYSCLPNHLGGIVDDLLVYRLEETNCSEGERAYMLVVNASNIQKDWDWLVKHNTFDTRLIDISDETGLIAVQGPNAAKSLQSLTDLPLEDMKYYTFKRGVFAGKDNVIVSATGYTGAGGFEIYAHKDHIADIWDAVMEAGKPFDIMPAGLGCRDTLRLEMGYCLYGNDIDDSTSPIEAGLGWITKLNKGNFHSSEFFAKQKEEGIVNKLVGLKLGKGRVPRQGYVIVDEAGRDIGRITSGTSSPTLDHPIAMGYISKTFSAPGTTVKVKVGKKELDAEVVKIPFFKK